MYFLTIERKRSRFILSNAALNEEVIASLRIEDMEIVLALYRINIRVAGILFFLSFVMASGGLAGLPLCFANRRIRTAAIYQSSLLRTVRGLYGAIQPRPIQPGKVLDLWAFVSP